MLEEAAAYLRSPMADDGLRLEQKITRQLLQGFSASGQFSDFPSHATYRLPAAGLRYTFDLKGGKY